MEIRAQSTCQDITWVIRDFWELPQEIKFLDSPEFLHRGDPYGIRLYPKMNGDKTAFHVRRLSGNSPEKEVSCTLGLKRREESGDERYDYYPMSLLQNICYSRSAIERDRDQLVPEGSLTILCTMKRAGSSAQGEEEQGGFPGHSASFSSRQSPAKMELTSQFPCTYVRLTVPNVFQLSESGDSLTSTEFCFAGNTYRLRFEPNGDTSDTDLRIVRLTSNFTKNVVCYRVGCGPSDCPTYSDNSRPLVGNVGFCVSLSTLEKKRDKYVDEDDVLYLWLFLHLGEQSSAGDGTSVAVHKGTGLTGIPNLQSEYRQILQDGTLSDACIVVQGKEFKVHRVVLCARSTVFAAMFNHDTAEKKSGRVVVDDLDPDTFGDFLDYLYTGDIQTGISDDNVFGLFVAADKYDVSTLKSQCVEHMRRTLSVDSFCDVVTLALRHSEEDLLQQSIAFLRDNFQRIIVTAKWQQFNIANGATANELFSRAFLPGTR